MEINNKLLFKLNKIYYFFFKERFKKKLNFNFPKKISRLSLINKLIKLNKYTSYLEIGCDQNQTFDFLNIKNKVGVDPFSGGTIRKTSDVFFKTNSTKFDIIFVDGYHEYYQVLRDIENSLKFLNKNGIILVHDTLPSSLSQQSFPRSKNTWNGDVWKAIVKLRTVKYCDIVTCKIDHGVSVIRKISNKNLLHLNIHNFKEELKFEDFYKNFNNYMRTLNFKETLKYLKKKY